MGKKSKNKKKVGGGRAAAAAATTTLVSADGRMKEEDGRRFYDLVAFLAEIAVPVLEARRRETLKSNYHPLGWRTFDYSVGAQGMVANSLEVRDAVMSFILREIDWLAEQVDGRRYDAMFSQLFNRRITEEDRDEIRSWRLHVQDDFFCVASRVNEGAIFVQVGSLDESMRMDDFYAEDFHEPRVFLVRGLADSIESLLRNPIANFRRKHPSIAEMHPDSPIALVNTTLLPYNGGITYMTLIKPPVRNHYPSTKALVEATDIAIQASRGAFEQESSITLYRALDAESDSHIRRLAHGALNQNEVPSELQFSFSGGSEQISQDSSTTLFINQVFWTPYAHRSDPRSDAAIRRVIEGPKPFQLEGMKGSAGQEIIFGDDDACPFHNWTAFGEAKPSFKDCCKDSFLRRKLESKQRDNVFLSRIMYEPVEREEAEAIAEKEASCPDAVHDLSKYLRVGYQDVGVVRLTIPTKYVPLVKSRMDNEEIFHAVKRNKWIYFGYIPIRMAQLGIMTMGDIELFPGGIFEGTAMTSGRLTNLIREMKRVCTDIPVTNAEIQMQPSHKLKPDKEALRRNRELLQEGLDLKVSRSIDKKENAPMRKRCAYCSKSESDDNVVLGGCPCKMAYYCRDTDHQKLDWPNHKKACKQARARMKADGGAR